jgi:hypothetical protein
MPSKVFPKVEKSKGREASSSQAASFALNCNNAGRRSSESYLACSTLFGVTAGADGRDHHPNKDDDQRYAQRPIPTRSKSAVQEYMRRTPCSARNPLDFADH